MKTNLFSTKSHYRVGPGGWYCSCCGPSPKNRPLFAKLHKRQVNRLLDKFFQD